MMNQHRWWFSLYERSQQNCICVLVTVAKIAGSTPREVGSSMLLWLDEGQVRQSDTIGGGHLEFQAVEIARDMLHSDDTVTNQLKRFNLSAQLGQCCGGVMWLIFEKIQPSPTLANLIHSTTWLRQLNHDGISIWAEGLDVPATQGLQQHDTGWSFSHRFQTALFDVLLFGAGHVGEAIVRALLPIGVNVRWVDSRDDFFPKDLTRQVRCISTDTPEAELTQFSQHGAVLILTHDHQLDLQLCWSALKQPAFRFLGMIGSKSKRAIFEKRLIARGIESEKLTQLVCPIGISGMTSKQPACIAVAVVAQLLQYYCTA